MRIGGAEQESGPRFLLRRDPKLRTMEIGLIFQGGLLGSFGGKRAALGSLLKKRLGAWDLRLGEPHIAL